MVIDRVNIPINYIIKSCAKRIKIGQEQEIVQLILLRI